MSTSSKGDFSNCTISSLGVLLRYLFVYRFRITMEPGNPDGLRLKGQGKRRDARRLPQRAE